VCQRKSSVKRRRFSGSTEVDRLEAFQKEAEENFKLCPKTVGNSHVMPDKNFI